MALTGASITSGRTLKITLNLDDSLIDSGYEVRVDSAVEDMRDIRADVGTPDHGRLWQAGFRARLCALSPTIFNKPPGA